MVLWKNDTEPLEDVRSREYRQWPARHPCELANQTPSDSDNGARVGNRASERMH